GEDVEEAARLAVRGQVRGNLDQLPVVGGAPGRVEDQAAGGNRDAGLVEVVGKAHAPAGAAGDQGERGLGYPIGHLCLRCRGGIVPRLLVLQRRASEYPAKAGAHAGTSMVAARWAPAFAGATVGVAARVGA